MDKRSTNEDLWTKVNLSTALNLLEIISKMMVEHKLDKSLLDWACILLDSHYQQYLLSKDITVMDTIKEVHSAVKEQMDCLIGMKELLVEMHSLQKGRISAKKKTTVSSHSYSVDTITLY